MKRTFDVLLSLVGLVLVSPLLGFTACLVLVCDGRPIFFRQERIGYRGKRFRIWKFRTMVCNAEKLGKPLTVGGDSRVTRLGSFLRSTKLDELPQLLNVLAGEMSLVGPRPEVQRYVQQYTDEQRQVLELTPGITDAASIKFRHESELLARQADPEHFYLSKVAPEKIRLNLEYARNANLLRDIIVILKTIAKLCWR